MKVQFTPDELHTPEYKEYVKWVGDCWRMNDERNTRLEKEKMDLIERTRPVITEKDLTQAREVAKRLVKEKRVKDMV
jgi:hypothetical protein